MKANPYISTTTLDDYIRDRGERDPAFAVAFAAARARRELARVLRQARVAKHLSAAALARRAGTTPAAVAQFEAGRFNARVDTLRAIAAALGYALNIQFVPLRAKTART